MEDRPYRNSPANRGRSATRRRADIQGLRAVAVLLVALNHAGVGFLKGGYVGVDVFFVLSGFLITGILVSAAPKASRAAYFLTFYASRARRILPAAALTLVATNVAAVSLLNIVRAHQVAQDSVWAVFFAANVHFASIGTNYFAAQQPPSPLQHFWSLAVEEQFYVVWPLVVSLAFGVMAWRRRPGTARRLLAVIALLITGASLAYSIYDVHHNSAAAYFSTLGRAWELGLGAALSLAASRIAAIPKSLRAIAGWCGLGAIVVASIVFSASTLFPGYAALLPTLGAAAIIGSGLSQDEYQPAVSRVLGLSPLRYVGDRSYTFYLWHWPILILAMEHVGHSLSVGINLLLLMGAFILSMFTYAFFENPIHRRPPQMPYRSLILWPAAVAVVLLAVGVIFKRYDSQAKAAAVAAKSVSTAPLPVPTALAAFEQSSNASPAAVIAAVKAAKAGSALPSPLTPPASALASAGYPASPKCYLSTFTATKGPVCSFGSSTSTKTMVVFGDSHALMWMPDIINFAQQAGYDVRPIIKTSCNPFRWAGAGSQSGFGAEAHCGAWYKWALSEIKTRHPAVLLFAGHYNVSPLETDIGVAGPESITNVAAFGNAVRKSVGTIVTIGDPPGEPKEPADCLLAHGATMRSCTGSPSSAQTSWSKKVASVALKFGPLLNTAPWLCYANGCPMVIGSTIAYLDHDHITLTYAEELEPTFSAALGGLIASAP